MAERPSVKDILARVRAGGPVQPAAETASEIVEATPAVEEAVEAQPVVTSTEPAAPPAPTPASLGRPLTLKEKLAAAKNRPVGAAPAAPAAAHAAATVADAASAIPDVVTEAVAPASASPGLTPAELGRPLTLKEKLAAARGGAAPAAAPGGAAKPAAAKGAAATTAPKAASTRVLPPVAQATDPRDLAEHLRRIGAEREKKAKAEAVKVAPAAKVAPAKRVESKIVPPRPGKEGATATVATPAADVSRRVLFKVGFWIAAGWAAFMGGMAALTAMSLRFMFPNVLAEPPSTIKVGFPSDFEKGQVNERWKGEWGFWIVRSDVYDGEDKVYALSTICTHLGCPPNWLASEQKFKCPCHGSGFYISGVNFEGPAPRPLERYKVAVGDDGQIVVDKSQKFQEELGQWKDPECFIKA